MNVKKVTLLVGLPGSGKTTVGNFFIEKHNTIGKGIFIDDIGVLTQDAKSYLLNIDKEIDYIIISDVYFCKEKVLQAAKNLIIEIFPNVEVEILYFENNPEKCLYNVKERGKNGDNRKVEGLIKLLSKEYNVSTEKIIKIKNRWLGKSPFFY